MAQFTVHGKVEQFGPDQRNIRVHNWEELKWFWTTQDIDTRLDWADKGPFLVTVSAKKFVEQCRLGDSHR
jgi:hypothetical protein